VAYNFLACDRDQELLLPPSLREWLPEDHLAWFLIDAVEELRLDRFLADYREDGWGRAAYDPRMIVTLLLYAYAVGERSARGIERRCREDGGARSSLGCRRRYAASTSRSQLSLMAASSIAAASVRE
jgi:transposase